MESSKGSTDGRLSDQLYHTQPVIKYDENEKQTTRLRNVEAKPSKSFCGVVGTKACLG